MSLEPRGGFSADPFKLENANYRASTRDRDEVARILSEAYARGQLEDNEYHERLESALQIKVLGEVRTLLIDLGTPKQLMARPPSRAELAKVQHEKKGEVRKAVSTWVGVTVMLNVIYVLTALSGAGLYYYWPIWPMAGMLIWVVTAVVEARKPPDRKAIEHGDDHR